VRPSSNADFSMPNGQPSPQGDDDKVVSVTERAHNMPLLSQLLRALGSTAITTGLITLTMWP
jgi:hypothetical protein